MEGDVEVVDVSGAGRRRGAGRAASTGLGGTAAGCGRRWGELVVVGDGGGVGPVPVDGFGEDVSGAAGVVGFEGDVGVVGVPAAGEGDVDAAVVDVGVDEEEGVVDGAALGGVAGLRVGELDVCGDVVGGEVDGAGSAGGGDVAVAGRWW